MYIKQILECVMTKKIEILNKIFLRVFMRTKICPKFYIVKLTVPNLNRKRL